MVSLIKPCIVLCKKALSSPYYSVEIWVSRPHTLPSNVCSWILSDPLLCWISFIKYQKCICIFNNFSILRWHRRLIFIPMEDKNLFILHGQYHGCWCLGDVRSQGISSHGIDIVSSCSNRRVKTAFWLLKYLKMLGGVVHLCRLFFT